MDPKLLELLKIVIENYISRGEPVGSKFLNSLEDITYAPSTLRKYLNELEGGGYLYQPYHSAGRLPTIKGFSNYLDDLLINEEDLSSDFNFNAKMARNSLRFIVESLGKSTDGVVVGFLKNDEYYFLGINNLITNDSLKDYETIRLLIQFIENKNIIKHLNSKMIRYNQIKYSFIKSKDKFISSLYAKINVNGYEGIITVLGPVRINYKKNMNILQKFLKAYNSQI
ncbi:hypothetical protein [Candidatus Vampirococcus lugosii]|uniref:Heat-inducible transcription repressor hrcA n=1 Tax=Candidatus Vampirococcus lugosii TaxID=2789015 RepID=A0ABS5QLS8_9BACT|nr:hypothetical protein [Candidatus Vampirococcus lugosii]MBS8122143.1 heat-inducible transcription repressor hrcA [Candidatus Vampirococcus lugosii]